MEKLACKICKKTTNNPVELGDKIIHKEMAVHYFCLLLSSNLTQAGRDDEGFLGFLIKDIEKEIKRAVKIKCFYCKELGASIGCCHKVCRRSFHLPCAVLNNCRFEFLGTYRSFCHQHHGIKTTKKHEKNETCSICLDKMGKFHPLKSVRSPCCNKSIWYHKLCLMEMAKTAGYFFKCPLCSNKKYFRHKLAQRGIFIPDKDASWELEPNAFVELNEQNRECEAGICLCSTGRQYDGGENNRFELMTCEYCGSHYAHRHCIDLQILTFVCVDCQPNDSASESSFTVDTADSSYSTESYNQPSNMNSDDCMDCSGTMDVTFSKWFQANELEPIDVDEESNVKYNRNEPCITIDLTAEAD